MTVVVAEVVRASCSSLGNADEEVAVKSSKAVLVLTTSGTETKVDNDLRCAEAIEALARLAL